jgi:hypothetical protein
MNALNIFQSVFRTLTLLFFFITGIGNVYGIHMAGTEIGYECIGSRKWMISLRVYTRCSSGSSICSNSPCTIPVGVVPSPEISSGGLNPNGCNKPVNVINLTLQLVSVEDAEKSRVIRCGAVGKNNCTNMGANAAGTYQPGYEVYTFQGVLDMSDAIFDHACPYWTLFYTDCCRGSSMNILGQPTWYVESTLHIFDAGKTKTHNSSPVFKNESIITFCAGTEQLFNLGAVDPDHDSLSYELVKALSSGGTPVGYAAPYSETMPFPLVATLPPHSTQAGSPSIVLDPVTGDMALNALNTSTSAVTGIFVLRIKQWRYREEPAGSGIMRPYVTGMTTRDIEILSIVCPGNVPPRFNTSPALPNGSPQYSWSVCAGEQICFNITARDEDVTDSTWITWDKGIDRPVDKLSFKPDYTPASIPPEKPREDIWKFCWQTEFSDGNELPYYFTVRADDNKCPNPGRIIHSFSINVRSQPSVNLVKTKLQCGKWIFNVRKTNHKQYLGQARLEVAKSPNDPTFAGGSHERFSTNPNPGGSGATPTTILADTVQFTQPGMYFIRYMATINGTEGCVGIFYDSVYVDTLIHAMVPAGITKCKNDSVLVPGAATGGARPYTYRWYRNTTQGAPVNGPDFQQNTSFVARDTVNTIYLLRVQDVEGCMHLDSFSLSIKKLSQAHIQVNNSNQCLRNNSFIFTHDDPYPFTDFTRKWVSDTITSTDSVFTISYATAGTRAVKLLVTDLSGCRDSVTIFVKVGGVEPSIANVVSINDSIQCLNENAFVLTYNKPVNEQNTFTWLIDGITSTASPYTHKFQTPGIKPVRLAILNIAGCSDTTAPYYLVVNPSPVLARIAGPLTNLSAQGEYDYNIQANANYTYHWTVSNGMFMQGNSGSAVRVKWLSAGPGSLTANQSLGLCTVSDSVKVTIGTVGLSDINTMKHVFIKPNPNHGSFIISMDSAGSGPVHAVLYNIFGEQVWDQNTIINTGTNEMNVSMHLPAGIYLLEVNNRVSKTIKRIVINP